MVLLFTVVTVYTDKQHQHYSLIIKENLVTAPIHNLLEVMNVDFAEAERKLLDHNIQMGDAQSIIEIALNNNRHPGDILEIIVK